MFELNYETVSKQISDWIRQVVQKAGFTKVVIAVSGGIDSAVSLSLAVAALGKENVFPILLPFGQLSDEHTNDAKHAIASLAIPEENVTVINIKDTVESILKNLDTVDNIRKGNIMARTRMMYVFDLAKKQNALVCGTENKTEDYLGYFTRFGDEASDLEPIKSLYKTQVWEMGKYLKVPEKIIQKAPTAGLWEEQTDEGELGFTYKDADAVLYYRFDQKLTPEEIVQKGIVAEIVAKVLERVEKNDFKHALPHEFNG